MRTRSSFNRKRKICGLADLPAGLDMLAGRVGYGGNPEHNKRNPGDFGLTPPSAWRPDKALCDGVGIFERHRALTLLREGIRRGMIGPTRDDVGFPRSVWSVTEAGEPLEAQLENPAAGTYHGYPMPTEDPMHDLVLKEWRLRSGRGDGNG